MVLEEMGSDADGGAVDFGIAHCANDHPLAAGFPHLLGGLVVLAKLPVVQFLVLCAQVTSIRHNDTSKAGLFFVQNG